MMTPERWQHVEQLYEAALERKADDRIAFLDKACGDDHVLRREVESLLQAEREAGSFIEMPAVDFGAGDRPLSPSLRVGSQLGPYSILGMLGTGGMGEVYKARDPRLGRDVAIKVLPTAFTADPDRLRRFEQEARAAAALNHPNILTVHEIGAQDGRPYVVSELLDGRTLREVLAGGALAVKQAIDYAIQICHGLAAAHEKGIVHRDLKPENLFIYAAGRVKILDFGLAKLTETTTAVTSKALGLMGAPTAGTDAGTVLGTVGYMSPEQLRGQTVDHQSDIFSFGAVLYEMLAGERAFKGDSPIETLGVILKQEPKELTSFNPDLPLALQAIVGHCLEKTLERRYQSARDIAFALETLLPSSVASPRVAPERQKRWLVPLVTGLAVAALSLFGLLAGRQRFTFRRGAPPRVTRTTIAATGLAAPVISGIDRDLALTPDGARILYVGSNGTQLFIRPLDELAPRALVSSPFGVFSVFTSPDGQWVGYAEGVNGLRKVPITGGPSVALLDMDGGTAGATWLPDDTIIFATSNAATGLQRVSAAGGATTVLTRPNRDRGEADHVWPEALPGGRAVLFTILPVTGGPDAAQVAVLDLTTGAQQVLLRGGSHAQYLASGHLVYAAGGSLRAVAFDLARLAVRGTSVPVLSPIVSTPLGGADVSVAGDGTLVYLDAPGSAPLAAHTLVWVDRQGREQPLAVPPRPYLHPRLSPDGTRVALFSGDQDFNLWIWNLARATLTRLTSEPGADTSPVWTPDGRRVVFTSQRRGVLNLFWQAADSTDTAERLTESANVQVPTGITRDGSQLVFFENTSTAGSDLMLLTLTPPRRVTPLLATRFNERNGIISPDGRWLAYESDSSGRDEIYVRPFPAVGAGQWQVSTAGGRQPLWARNGRELFYAAPDGALLSVLVEPHGDAWNAGTPGRVVEGRYLTTAASISRSYDVSLDGQRFLLLKQAGADPGAGPPQIIVIQHWDEELKRLVPTK
jgi:serine/threonine protein kinase